MNDYYLPKIEDITQISKIQFAFKDKDKNFVMPKLHSMFYKYPGPNNEDGFSGVCLELNIFSWGMSLEGAQDELIQLCKNYFTNIIIENNNPKQLFEDVAKTDLENFWGLYRQISVWGASCGILDSESQNLITIEELIKENTSLKEENSNLKNQIRILEKEKEINNNDLVGAYILDANKPNSELLKQYIN